MISMIPINLNDTDQATYQGLSGSDKSAYLITKLVLAQASNLIKALGNTNVTSTLSSGDKATLAGLIEAAAAVLGGN
jgi:hypothetical protein